MKRVFLTAAMVVATAGAALATDPFAYPDAGRWAGSYVGLQIGGAFGTSRAYESGGPTTDNFDISGIIGGYTSGYNWQSDSFVFGIESDSSLTNLDGTSTVNCPSICYSGVQWLSTLRARLGKAMGDVLLYATGGLAYGNVEYGGLSPNTVRDKTLFGWTAGAGGEIALNEDWSAKAEYLYVDLGDVTHPLGPTVFEFDNIHIVRVGINRKFDIFEFLGIY